MKVCFVHPDLGIGGAERLIVDAAAGLVRNGHTVTIYTSYHDKNHCFEETRDGTLEVRVLGDSLFPTSLFGNNCRAICAYLRNLHLASALVAQSPDFDIIISDQVSASIPILSLLATKILFYCHFPDKLLTQRKSLIKSIYRRPVDWLEEWTTGQADKVVVNSKFTRSIFESAFPSISETPDVLYPGIHTQSYQNRDEYILKHPSVKYLLSESKTIVSINRFERKKNVGLAIHAFAELIDGSWLKQVETKTLRLIIAGGYDPQSVENVQHLQELEALAKEHNLKTFITWDTSEIPEDTQVLFLPSFNTPQRTYLLGNAECLVYTPSGEHFGIVPVEAMYAKIPVVAVDSGGPRETIIDGETGFLVQPNSKEVAGAISQVLLNPELKKRLGNAGKRRVEENFTSEAFDLNLYDILESLKNDISDFKVTPLGCIFAWFLYTLFFPILLLKGEIGN